MLTRVIATLTFLVVVSAAQTPKRLNTYRVEKETSLSAAAETVTVQQPASGALTVVAKSAILYCSVECTVELERDGAAATATAATIAKVHGDAATAVAKAWHSSDVGNGTTIATYTVPAGATLVVDLSSVFLIGSGTGKNFSFRTNSITGTARITIFWDEY